jgi:site-specific recombinase XerD
LNPGSPTPQAGILNQSSQDCTSIPNTEMEAIRRPQQQTKYEGMIINTIIKATNAGKAKNTIRLISFSLKQINKHADLANPENVKAYVAQAPICNATKQKLILAYKWFAETNHIKWERPKYKWERKIPLIPTTENINKIISASTRKYATIFTILAETGIEAHELVTTQRKDIDAENGIINVQGCKGHNSRSIKLKATTAEMLRTYLTEYTTNNPFPNSKAMSETWRQTRNKLAETLNQPHLKNIPMRNLRHHFATMTYDKTKDILLVKQLLGHKKLETTMFYTQLVTINTEEEYTCRTATNIKEATELIEAGFQYITDIDGFKLFRKRK